MKQLNERSKQVRRDTLKLSKANGGYHYGGSFSCVEILICLYDEILESEDKFILSKGHACYPYYVLLREKGLDPKLEGHPILDEKNGVHFTTGSEGHGMPAAVGMALARKIQGKKGRIYVLIGDGECQEGTTWESLLTASFRRLDNLTVIVDYNGIQGAGFLKNILPLSNFPSVGAAIGWSVSEIDGHDPDELLAALEEKGTRPRLIIAYTVKGKGVSYMQNKPEWHAAWVDGELEAQAFKELEAK